MEGKTTYSIFHDFGDVTYRAEVHNTHVICRCQKRGHQYKGFQILEAVSTIEQLAQNPARGHLRRYVMVEEDNPDFNDSMPARCKKHVVEKLVGAEGFTQLPDDVAAYMRMRLMQEREELVSLDDDYLDQYVDLNVEDADA